MKKIIALAFVLIFSISCLAGCGSTPTPPTDERVKNDVEEHLEKDYRVTYISEFEIGYIKIYSDGSCVIEYEAVFSGNYIGSAGNKTWGTDGYVEYKKTGGEWIVQDFYDWPPDKDIETLQYSEYF